jgi:parvulin-like peptidyl-prolyl isomerase
MTLSVTLADRTLASESLFPLLAGYKLIPQLLCELIIDRAISDIQCTPEESDRAGEEFYKEWRLTDSEQRHNWLSHYGLTQQNLEQLATRKLRIEKFKEVKWGRQIRSDFLQRKRDLDRVIYSLIRTKDPGLAVELYFRIKEGEQSFGELATQYSQGEEAKTDGILGPMEFGSLHSKFAQYLYTCPVGEVQTPIGFGDWQLIVRVEEVIPAQLDEATHQRFLNEKFEAWFKEQLQDLSDYDRIWMGVPPREQVDLPQSVSQSSRENDRARLSAVPSLVSQAS